MKCFNTECEKYHIGVEDNCRIQFGGDTDYCKHYMAEPEKSCNTCYHPEHDIVKSYCTMFQCGKPDFKEWTPKPKRVDLNGLLDEYLGKVGDFTHNELDKIWVKYQREIVKRIEEIENGKH